MQGQYKKYLPSKHFIKVLLLCIVVVAVILATKTIIAKKNARKLATTEQEKDTPARFTGTLVSISSLTEKDTDGDGVADWEEALWGTDPTKTDTDGNGIDDKTEIDQKKATLGGTKQTTDTQENLTETQAFSRELFASIAALKQSGNLNDQSIRDLAQTISENAGDKEIIINTYTSGDITTTDDTAKAITEYRNRMLALLRSYDNSGIDTELPIIDESLSSNDAEKIAELYPIAKAYKELAKKIVAIPVPQSLAQNHLLFANSANNISIALGNITTIYVNALSGLIGISQYQEQSTQFDQTLADIQDYFTKNGIIH